MKNLLALIICSCIFLTMTAAAQDKKSNGSKTNSKQSKKKSAKKKASKKKSRVICALPQ